MGRPFLKINRAFTTYGEKNRSKIGRRHCEADMAGQRQRVVVVEGSKASPTSQRKSLGGAWSGGKKNHSLSVDITEKPAGPHTGWLC